MGNLFKLESKPEIRGESQTISSEDEATYFSRINNLLRNSYVKNMYNDDNLSKSLELKSFNTSLVQDMGELFGNCQKLNSINISNFDAKNVENMIGMFEGCSQLKSLNLSNFETKSLEDADYFLFNCSNLDIIDLRKFDTHKLKNTTNFFSLNSKNATLIYNSSIFNLTIPSNWTKVDINNNTIN